MRMIEPAPEVRSTAGHGSRLTITPHVRRERAVVRLTLPMASCPKPFHASLGKTNSAPPENNFPSSTQPTRERSSIFFQFATKYTIDPVPVAHILKCARQGFPVRTVKATGCLSCFLIAIPIVQSLY